MSTTINESITLAKELNEADEASRKRQEERRGRTVGTVTQINGDGSKRHSVTEEAVKIPHNHAGCDGCDGCDAFPEGAPARALLGEVLDFYRRYVVIDEEQLLALGLWTMHTHVIDATEITPYVFVSSPEKRSGKTTLLDTAATLVARPLPTSNISPAALYRVIEEVRPTVVFDEVDAVFDEKNPNHPLRGVLNAGFRRGSAVYRMGGTNNTTVETYDPFGAKILAGIGATTLPDTVADRSIEIRMRRKLPAETVQRFRFRLVTSEATPLRERLEEWAVGAVDELRNSAPELPDELDDRAQDLWEPLLAIADLAGDEWAIRARAAARHLSGEIRQDESKRTKLLEAVRDALTECDDEAVFTRDLLRKIALDDDESLFRGWWDESRDEPQAWAPRKFGQTLREFGVPKSKTVRIGDETAKGYLLDGFADAFARYLPTAPSGNPSQASHP